MPPWKKDWGKDLQQLVILKVEPVFAATKRTLCKCFFFSASAYTGAREGGRLACFCMYDTFTCLEVCQERSNPDAEGGEKKFRVNEPPVLSYLAPWGGSLTISFDEIWGRGGAGMDKLGHNGTRG